MRRAAPALGARLQPFRGPNPGQRQISSSGPVFSSSETRGGLGIVG